MARHALSFFTVIALLILGAVVSALCMVLLLVQPDFALTFTVSSLLTPLSLSSLGGFLVLACAALFIKDSAPLSWWSSPLFSNSLIGVYLLGLIFSLLITGERAAVRGAATSLERVAPASEYVAAQRTMTTLEEWKRARAANRTMNRASMQGEELFKMLLGIQGASTHPAWQEKMKALSANGVLFADDLRWMVTHLQEETRQGRPVNAGALAVLSGH